MDADATGKRLQTVPAFEQRNQPASRVPAGNLDRAFREFAVRIILQQPRGQGIVTMTVKTSRQQDKFGLK